MSVGRRLGTKRAYRKPSLFSARRVSGQADEGFLREGANMKEDYIVLSSRKGVIKCAVVDHADSERVLAVSRTWYLHKGQYAVCRKTTRMHRVILGDIPFGNYCDHINGDGLDNRRENLRCVTNQQNGFNRGKHINKSSRHKGVSRERRGWRASIRVSGRTLYLGNYASEEQAAKVYNAAAITHFGDFARCNVV